MSAAAGLLGYLSIGLAPERVAEAARRAPWRGPISATLSGPTGEIHALGQATAVRRGAVSAALHGRIDNLAELAGRLQIEDPEERPCAVLIAAYQRFGDDFADHLLGDFAALVLDDRRGALLGIRDWVGTRPLFWGRCGEVIVFASEVKQILALLDKPFESDESTLAAYAALTTPALEATFAKGVSAIPPNGQVLARPEQGAQAWRRNLRFQPTALSLGEAAPLARERLAVAVRRRTAAATHLGSMLSGGMDSTSVVATAALLAEQGASPPLRLTLTTSYPEVPASDETVYARQVASRWSIPWQPVVIHPRDFLTWPEEGFAAHDGPTFPAFRVFASLAAAAAAEGVDVLLTGEAGDNWLRQHGRELEFSLLRWDWHGVVRWGLHTARHQSPGALARTVARTLVRRVRQGDRVEAYYEDGAAHYNLRTSLETQEREAMRRGVRIEFPFCDREFVALLASLPPSVRSMPWATKRVMREAMSQHLPQEVLARSDWTTLDPVLLAALGEPSGDDVVLPRLTQRFADTWRQILAGSGSGRPLKAPNDRT
jgi:asparagine synthetase B (glutamine-hydrolysing)